MVAAIWCRTKVERRWNRQVRLAQYGDCALFDGSGYRCYLLYTKYVPYNTACGE